MSPYSSSITKVSDLVERYLAVDKNKVELAEFLTNKWKRQEYASRLQHRYLFVSHRTTCTRLTSIDYHLCNVHSFLFIGCREEKPRKRKRSGKENRDENIVSTTKDTIRFHR